MSADGAHAPPLRVRGLVKRYGALTAVDSVDVTVERGDVYGFLGPNGAGKTTTLRMMLGLIRPDSGSVELFGRDPLRHGARALDGVAGFVEAPQFYPYLSARKNLELLAAFDGGDAAARIDQSLETVELAPRAGDRVGGYSHGMRQRLGIAAALLRSPHLLLLDEPATGLDPAGMRDMRDLIRDLAREGITVVLSSHLLVEVEDLCNRVAIVRRGKVLYEGSLAGLRDGDGAAEYVLRSSDVEAAAQVCGRAPGVAGVARAGEALKFHAVERDVAALSLALAASGVAITELVCKRVTLEDVFLRLTEDPEGEAPI
ncbi:MAG TPA: ABC transporter ATP-binding protein [Solirubrobacteraceae bacterium]